MSIYSHSVGDLRQSMRCVLLRPVGKDPLRGARLTRYIEKEQQDQAEEEYSSITDWLCIFAYRPAIFFKLTSQQQHGDHPPLLARQNVKGSTGRPGIHGFNTNSGA